MVGHLAGFMADTLAMVDAWRDAELDATSEIDAATATLAREEEG